MAINDFKTFATGAGANVISQEDWQNLPALLTGWQSGVASSAQMNKAIRQALFIASALAQYTADKSGLDVLDDGDIAGFVAKMSAAFGKDFQPLDATLTALATLTTGANKLPYFTGADAAALTDFTDVGRSILGQTTIANLLSYLGLGTAALRSVGTGTNQIPDMSSFTVGSNWFRLPGGFIVQFFTALMADTSAASKVVSFPFAFPNGAISVVATHNGPVPSAAGIFGINNLSKTSFQSYVSVTPAGSIGAFVIAVGY